MGARLAEIRRHPIKSVGVETMPRALLRTGEALEMDRAWAIAHGRSKFDVAAPEWVKPGEFLRVTHSPRLAQVRAQWDGRRIALSHPDQAALLADPFEEGDEIAAWAGALASDMQPGPWRLARCAAALTDVPHPWLSIGNLATLRALGQRMGAVLDPTRFRANLWLDGLAPWEEREWVGRTLSIGTATLRVTEEVWRCRATEANPSTGLRDADVLSGLRGALDDTCFAVYAEVSRGGEIAAGDAVLL